MSKLMLHMFYLL